MSKRDMCLNCNKPIVFEPYYLDGRLPNPAVWFHEGAGFTCGSAPARGKPWPLVSPPEPVEVDHV